VKKEPKCAVQFRRMIASDIDEVIRLQAESNVSDWSRAGYEEFLDVGDSIAEIGFGENGEILGFVSARIITSDRSCEIFNIAVKLNQRRLSIGSELLDRIVSRVRSQADVIHLEVRESNQPARNFYRNYGFEEVGKRVNYYSNPKEDAILMSLQINRGV